MAISSIKRQPILTALVLLLITLLPSGCVITDATPECKATFAKFVKLEIESDTSSECIFGQTTLQMGKVISEGIFYGVFVLQKVLLNVAIHRGVSDSTVMVTTFGGALGLGIDVSKAAMNYKPNLVLGADVIVVEFLANMVFQMTLSLGDFVNIRP